MSDRPVPDPISSDAWYRQRPPEVEAVQFTGTPESCTEIGDFLGGPYSHAVIWENRTTDGGCLTKRIPSGSHIPRSDGTFQAGCWIVRSFSGDYSVYRDEDFRRCFEKAQRRAAMTHVGPHLFPDALYVVAVRLIRMLDRAMGWEPPSEDSTGVWA